MHFTADHPSWLQLFAADLVATAVVFGFSVARNNSSLYDPYWSVAPPALAAGWLVLEPDDVSARSLVALGLICLWGYRLTYSFLRGWPGLHHEDFRYRDIRAKTGRLYWVVSLLGVHLFPTLLTFGGTVAFFAAASGDAPLGVLDGVAAAVTLGAIALEAAADRQLSAFVKSGPEKGAILASGVWAYSRHPNYLGEMMFWWGLALFAIAAGAPLEYALPGATAITLLFLLVSLPLIEKRMASRRPTWSAHVARVPLLIPWRLGPLRYRSD